MFEDFKIKSLFREYSVYFRQYKSSLLSEIKEGDIIIVDQTILNLYSEVKDIVLQNKYFEIIACENSKTYEEIGKLITRIIESGFSKNNRLIAIGGGVTQDITAFASSILFRGVEWIFFPTNLLTQCDSCIGSKTSVNCGDYKNQLGGFYPPSKIFIDFDFCSTLSMKEISSGLGEMMHYFLVDGCDDLSFLHEEIRRARLDKESLAELVNRSLKIKSKMIQIDEFDRGPRNVFNYGHSFGHAIESATNFKVPHGIAVAYGMDLANILSAKLGLIDIQLRNEVRPILETVWSEVSLPAIELDEYFFALSKDKKNIGSDINVILTKGLGNMFKTKLSQKSEIKRLISEYFSSKLYEKELCEI